MNPPDRLRWGDSRLDDKFGTIADELRALRELPRTMAKFEIQMENLHEDVAACATSIKEHRDEYAADRKEARVERRTDIRWAITALIAAAGLIVGALTLILGHLG